MPATIPQNPANKNQIKQSQIISLDTFKNFIRNKTIYELVVIHRDIREFTPSTECLEAVEAEIEKRGYDPDDLFFDEIDDYFNLSR